MNSELDNEKLLKRFLLGDLSESERTEMEDRFLADDNLFQELLIGEDDLIDAYVRGELPAAESALFERCCLSTQHGRQRIEFAQTLFNSLSDKTEAIVATREQATTVSWWRSLFDKFVGHRPVLSFTLAAALLVVIFGGLWLLRETARTRFTSEPEQARQTMTPTSPPLESTSPPANVPLEREQSQREKENSNSAPSRETPKKTSPVIATFTLLPGMVRGESGAGALILPDGATEVRLRLMLEGEDYKQYRATLLTPEGRKLWGRVVAKGTSKKSGNLGLSLPANLLKSGDYVLGLSGANSDGKWESVADYSFRILRK